MDKKHFVYKTTNKINGKFYIGIHTTKKLDDGYLGSGLRLGNAIQKYGRENFEREILSYWPTRAEALIEERRLVDLGDPNCYNLAPGGQGGHLSGESHPLFGTRRHDSSVRMTNANPSKLEHVRAMLKETAVGCGPDGTGRYLRSDPRWKTGEIISVNKGMITVKDREGVVFRVTKDDPRWLNKEVVHITKGKPKTANQMAMYKIIRICPACGKEGRGGSMKRWHFDNCKHRK